jgi:protein-disulfide isomerase
MRKAWYKKWWVLLLIVFSTLLIILASAIFFKAKQINQQIEDTNYSRLTTNSLSAQERQTINGINNYWLGTSTPQITIVEFADFACTYCKSSYQKIREISITHQDSIKFIFRDYPINTETSLLLANAARCAGEQDLFWEAHDKLFQNQGVSEEKEIKNLMDTIGINKKDFNNCFDNQKYLNDIKKDIRDGQSLGVSGTPTWFINGHMIKGDIPQTTWNKIIKELNK